MSTIDTDTPFGNVMIEGYGAYTTLLALCAFLLNAALFPAMTTIAADGRMSDWPGLSSPRVLYNGHDPFMAAKDWTYGSFSSLAFTSKNSRLVGSLKTVSQTKLFLPKRIGEVRTFDLAHQDGAAKLVKSTHNEWIDILTVPSGVARTPLLLARSRAIRPKEIVVSQVSDSGVEDVVHHFPIPRAEEVTIHTANSFCVALSSSPEIFIVGTSRMDRDTEVRGAVRWWGDVKAWDLRTGTVLFADAWDGFHVVDLACSFDGTWIAAAGGRSAQTIFGGYRYEGRVVCWEKGFETKRFDLVLPHHQVQALAFSPNSKTLVTGGLDGVVKWIDVCQAKVMTSTKVASRSGKTLGRIESLAFSPDGKMLAAGVGSWNRGNKWGETFLIDVSTLEVYTVVSSQEDHVVTCVAFSPDGKYLAAGGMEGILKLWRIDAGKTASQGVGDGTT